MMTQNEKLCLKNKGKRYKEDSLHAKAVKVGNYCRMTNLRGAAILRKVTGALVRTN